MNVVNKIRMELDCRDELQARKLIANWTPHLADALQEVLSEVCERLDHPSKTIVIDRLELHLGNLTGESFSAQLRDMKAGLLKSLSEQFKGTPGTGESAPGDYPHRSGIDLWAHDAHVPHTQAGPETDTNSVFPHLRKKIQEPVRVIHRSERLEEAFFYFLIHGNLPWWQKPEGFVFDRILQDLLDRPDHTLWQLWTVTTSARYHAAARIVLHAERDTLARLFAMLSLPEMELLSLAQLAFPSLQGPVVEKSGNMAFLTETLHLALDFSSGKQAESAVLTNFLANRFRQPGGLPDSFFKSTERRSFVHPAGFTHDRSAQQPGSDGTQPATPADHPAMPQEALHTEALFPKQAETGEKFATGQAGLVLFAGYLHYFFQKMGLRNAEGFVSETAQMQAIHALHYVATTRLNPPEYELALEKLLCGLHPSTPVLIESPPDVESLEREAGELLDSLIGAWSILKSTSREAVRKTFLHRNGMLECLSEHEWILHVETGSYDLLLPIGFVTSTLAFSWSKYILHVNWQRP